MKKQLFKRVLGLFGTLALGSCFLPENVSAQPAASYGFEAESGVYTPISGTDVTEINTDDESSYSMLPLNFTFNFCGFDYTEVRVNSNGWLSFGDVYPDYGEMRNNETYNLYSMVPMVMPWWDDLSGSYGSFSYTTEGTSPNQVFIAQWSGWSTWYSLGYSNLSFQVKLYEGTNKIEFVYDVVDPGTSGNETATIGIANTDLDWQILENSTTAPTTSSFDWYNYIYDKPATGQIYRWLPPPACTGTPVPGDAVASVATVDCEGNVDLSLDGNGLATQLEYQWEYSTDGGTTWLPIGSPQSNEYASFNVTETSLIHAVITCLASGESATSTPVTVTSNPPAAGISQASPSLVCNGSPTELSLAGNTTQGVLYQWQSSDDNVNFDDIGGATDPTYTTAGITEPIYYRALLSCDVNGNSNVATSIFVDTLTTEAPLASPAVSTITCGDSVVLTGTPSGNASSIVWYDQATGGTPIATGENVTLFPVTDITYYAENGTAPAVTEITTNNSAIVDHNAETGDDRGGIALSSQYLYVTGDDNTVRLNKFTLGDAAVLPRRDGIFSEVSSQTVYCFGDVNGVDNDYAWNGGTIDRIYLMDNDLNTVGAPVMLSQSFSMPSYPNPYFIAPGDGYVLLMETDYTNYIWHRIDLVTGNVTQISTTPIEMYDAEAFASWGWSEFDGGNYHVVFNKDNAYQIAKMNLTTGVEDIIGNFSYLSDMASIAFDPGTMRMYFHNEGSTDDFGGDMETAGYTDVIVSGGCGDNARTPVQVIVVPPVPTITPAGTFNICSGGTASLAASAGASYQWYIGGNPINGATAQSYTATTPGDYTVEVVNGDGCPGMSLATTVAVQAPQVAAASIVVGPNDTICTGTSTTFTATPVNGGLNTSYQWKKNGANVGTNSPTYTTPALMNGDQINVVMTVGPGVCTVAPTATSNTITMTVNPNVAPTISINADPGLNACADDDITFTANMTNSGTAPMYQWQAPGMTGNAPTFTVPAGTLSTGDVVTLTLTSNLACALPTSVTQSVVMTVDPLTTPVANITASETNICQGTEITFTATDNAPGGQYQWLVNGAPSGPNNAVYSYAPGVGDVVSLEFTPPAAGCYVNTTVTTPGIAIFVTPGLPTQATVSASPLGAVQGQNIVLQANLFNFSTNYTVDWYINGSLYTTTNVPFTNYTKGAGTDDIYAVVSGAGLGCFNEATSPIISVVEWPASVGETSVNVNIEIFPNPFNNSVTVKGLDDGDEIRLMNLLGQTIQVWNPEKVTAEEVLKVTDLAAGSYLISIRSKDGIIRKIEKLQKM